MSPPVASRFGALRYLWLSLLVIAIDQLTKSLVVDRLELYEVRPVLGVLDLTRLHNTGAAFSFLADAGGWQRWFFVGLACVVSIGIVLWLQRLDARRNPALAVALPLVMGGAIGNVIDRLQHGHVIDFIHFHWDRAYFPAFNVADTAITIGAVLLIYDALTEGKRERRDAAARDSGGDGAFPAAGSRGASKDKDSSSKDAKDADASGSDGGGDGGGGGD